MSSCFYSFSFFSLRLALAICGQRQTTFLLYCSVGINKSYCGLSGQVLLQCSNCCGKLSVFLPCAMLVATKALQLRAHFTGCCTRQFFINHVGFEVLKL